MPGGPHPPHFHCDPEWDYDPEWDTARCAGNRGVADNRERFIPRGVADNRECFIPRGIADNRERFILRGIVGSKVYYRAGTRALSRLIPLESVHIFRD